MRKYNIPAQYKKKSPEIIPTIMSAAMGFFWGGTQELVRNSRVKRAISVRATEVLLYYANSADSVQTAQNVASDQGQHCLLKGICMQNTEFQCLEH